jgi:hypothetical protein
MKAALEHKRKTGRLEGLKGTTAISNAELLELKCDILVPAAMENQITSENAPKVKASILAEAANATTTPAADEVLIRNGTYLIPDILCNSGGVIVSYFEWVQDLQGLFWSEGSSLIIGKDHDPRLQEVHDISRKKSYPGWLPHVLAVARWLMRPTREGYSQITYPDLNRFAEREMRRSRRYASILRLMLIYLTSLDCGCNSSLRFVP